MRRTFTYLIKFLKIAYLLPIFFFTLACKKDTNFDKKSLSNENFFISLEEAVSQAPYFNKHEVSFNKTTARTTPKEIVSKFTIEAQGQPAMYIVNYADNKGFVILAADKREMPILAYAEEGNFHLTKDMPAGLQEWIEVRKQLIVDIRNKNNNPTIKPPMPIPPDDNLPPQTLPDCDAPLEVYETVPLLQTTWDQTCGYNFLCPPADNAPCGKTLTGCVATAMAQIMRYHQHPQNYNWNMMPNKYKYPMKEEDMLEVAKLMRDVGNQVDMEYGADASSANVDKDVPKAFKAFGYNSAVKYLPYENTGNFQVVKNEINAKKPVLFSGGHKGNGWFPSYEGGHAWVCDGYKTVKFPCTVSYLFFRMNWGWNSSNDGWYAYNNFNPGNSSYNYKSGIVVDIKK